MSYQPESTLRILAIDPYRKGFGFALMEGPEHLIDFGVKTVRTGKDKNAQSLKKIAAMIDRYRPNVVIVEEYQSEDYRRRRRARRLLRNVIKLAAEKKLKAKFVSRRLVKKVFNPHIAVTKRQISIELAKLFPELEPYLYRYRKPWMSETVGANIFDAVTLALIFFSSRTRNIKGRSANQQTKL